MSLSTVSRRLDRTRFQPVSVVAQVVVAAFIAVVLLIRSLGLFNSWKPPLWTDVTALPRESLLVLAPLLAAAGAWVGGWRHTLAVGAIPGRGWNRVASRQVLLLGRSVVIGTLGGLAPAILVTADRATGGHLVTWSILASLASYIAILVLGFAVGVAWRNRLAIVGAACLAYVVLLAPVLLNEMSSGNLTSGSTPRSFLSVSLVWTDFRAGVGRREAAAAAIERTLLFSTFAGAGMMASIYLDDQFQEVSGRRR